MAIRINESKIALTSGFENYLRVEKDGTVQGIADAVGSMEQWEPVFQVKRFCHTNSFTHVLLSHVLREYSNNC